MNPITPANFDHKTVARLIARGRRLQGEAVAAAFAKSFAAIGRLLRRPRPGTAARA